MSVRVRPIGGDVRIEEFATTDPRMARFRSMGPAELVDTGARCMLALREGRPVARLAWEAAGDVHGVAGLCGLVGWYQAAEAEAGIRLLHEARRRLAAAGAVRVLGPIDGSTWGSYRLALSDASGAAAKPPFLTEPRNPPDYPAHFEAAGFRQAALYESRIVRDLSAPREGERALAERLVRAGVRVRPLDLERLDEDLALLFELSTLAFRENLFYRPIPFARFREGCVRLLPLLDPDLVRLAFGPDGRLLAIVFAFPDPPPAAGGPPTRVVLKTVASRPGARCWGLSAFLADQVHSLAHAKGYGAVIHALMHADNASLRISRRYRGEPFRRYALYEAGP